MAPNAHYRYSAAVEYAQSQWESVKNRVHCKMQEDGSVVLVDPTQVTTNVEIQKIDPARLCTFEVQSTSAQHVSQITVNKLGKSRLSPFEPSPSSAPAAHSSVPISKKLDSSRMPFFEQPKVGTLNKDASPLINNLNQISHLVTIMVNDINEDMVSAPGPNIIKPSTPSNVNDLDHHKRSSSIGSTGRAKRHSMTDTIPNAENTKEMATIITGTHSGSDNIIEDNKPNTIPSKIPIPIIHHDNKGPSIGDKNAISTVSKSQISAEQKKKEKKLRQKEKKKLEEKEKVPVEEEKEMTEQQQKQRDKRQRQKLKKKMMEEEQKKKVEEEESLMMPYCLHLHYPNHSPSSLVIDSILATHTLQSRYCPADDHPKTKEKTQNVAVADRLSTTHTNAGSDRNNEFVVEDDDYILQIDAAADPRSDSDLESLYRWSGFNYINERKIIPSPLHIQMTKY